MAKSIHLEDIKFIFFDVGNTLLHKPKLYQEMFETLGQNSLSLHDLRKAHLKFQESYDFPDRTDRQFYLDFNCQFLQKINIATDNHLAERLYIRAKDLEWDKFEDVEVLSALDIPFGVITNWSTRLYDLLKEGLPYNFRTTIVSEECGYRKPSQDIYRHALKAVNLPAENVLMIGDSLRLDYNPALSVGMRTLLLDRFEVFSEIDRVKSINSLFELG